MKNFEIIPEPVAFNCWKHHAGFVRMKIKELVNAGEPKINKILKELPVIGTSLMDFYTGNLSPDKIACEILNIFNKNVISSIELYKEWIKEEGSDYRLISLPDGSKWTLRLGIDRNRFIHIHPARNSMSTIRVRALTLKTAILYLVISEFSNVLPLDISVINRLRIDYLDLPPIKSLAHSPGLCRLILLLHGKKK